MIAHAERPPCPHLPEAGEPINHTHLGGLRSENGPQLYATALRYAQQLWLRGFSARAILALDRAFFAQVPRGHDILGQYPMPYAALAWICRNHDGQGFMGNPRVSFQHVADRVRGPEARLKSARSWACWAVVCQARPDLPGDPLHHVTLPSQVEIEEMLREFGGDAEVQVWRGTLDSL